MRFRALTNVIVAGGLVCALVAGSGHPAVATSEQTTINLSTAMHDEALAYAEYHAWSVRATATGNPDVASLLVATANEERDDHFSQLAAAYQLVGSDVANLGTAIVDERAEARTLYPGFSAQAGVDGDVVAEELFAELARDECSHQRTLTRVRHVVTVGGRWPVLPTVSPVAIVAGPTQSTGRTLTNLWAAMRGEAFASARYLMFSQAAYQRGNTTVGAFFLRLSEIELYEHFAELASLAGLVSVDTTENLTSALAAEDGAVASYATWAGEATAVGDVAEAELFVEIRGDEVRHQAAFAAMLGG